MLKAFKKVPNLYNAIHECVERVGAELIQKEAFTLKEGLSQIDIIRDIAIPLNARLLSDLFYFDLKSEENPDGVLSATEFYTHLLNIRIWGVNNKGSLRSCGYQIIEELLAQGNSAERVTDNLWLTAFGGIGAPVTAFYEVLEFFLRPENASIWAEVQSLALRGDDAGIHDYVREAQRLTSSQRNMRVAVAPGELEGKQVQPGNVVIMVLVSAIFLLITVKSPNTNPLPQALVIYPLL